jgi:hypothetical protein
MSRTSQPVVDLRGWDELPDDTLFSIRGLDRTPLAAVPRRSRYALIRSGRLPCVLIGARLYVTAGAIRTLVARSARGGQP